MQSTLKTIMGLVVIGIVVIATFLYGNAQRQEQLRRDEDLKRAAASPSPSASVVAAATSPTPAITPANGGTQPVQTPAQAATSGQVSGSSIATPTPKATATPKATVTPKATPTPAVAVNLNQPQPATTPETGAGLETALGATGLVLALGAYRRSRRDLAAAHILPRG